MGSSLNLASTLGSGATTLVRANNTVGYFLPAMGGIYGQVQVAAGENVPGNKYMGARVGYAGGPVNVAVALGKTYKDGPMLTDFKDFNVGGSYNLGFMTLIAQYNKVDYSTRDQKVAMFGVTVPFGASTLKASYLRSSGKGSVPFLASAAGALPAFPAGVAGTEATQIAFGYQYDLSKRTAIYATVSSLNNDGTAATGAKFTVGQGPAQARGGDTSRGYNLGVRHSF